MKDGSSTRRAQRLLKWYPLTWRDRYGDEFIDLMEQEIADVPHSARRTLNVIYKGSTTRLRLAGVVGPALESHDQTRASMALIFVFSTMFALLAFDFWSIAMLSWNSMASDPSSLAVSLWTGAVTVFIGILFALVVAIFATLLCSAVKKIAKGGARRLLGPLSLVVSCVVYLLFSLRAILRFVISRDGVEWTHPGLAVKQLAGATDAVTSTVNWIWGSPRDNMWIGANFMYAMIPVVLLALSLGVAALIRRTEFSVVATRLGRVALILMASAMVLFVVSYFGLIAASSQDLGLPFNQQLSSATLLTEFVVMALLALASVWTLRRRKLTRSVLPAESA